MKHASQMPIVKSADRVLDLLELLCSNGRPMAHTEIASVLSIPKSSLSQLLATLEARGYVGTRVGTNAYEPGPAIDALLAGSRSSLDLQALLQNVVDVLSKKTQETASFYRARGKQVERIIVTNSLQPLRYWMQAGEMMPIHATSGGKAILAAINRPQRNQILSKLELSRVTPHTITSRAVLKTEIEEIERSGIAYSRGEFEEGVLGIGVAVLRPDGQPEGSLSVVVPTPRDKASHRTAIIKALLMAKERLETEFRRSGTPLTAG